MTLVIKTFSEGFWIFFEIQNSNQGRNYRIFQIKSHTFFIVYIIIFHTDGHDQGVNICLQPQEGALRLRQLPASATPVESLQ